ncbi:hypothetical protein EVC30_080 [Rhizobium phage RHph_Y1_11]|nr:hypothetical protein EVC30_080 [Rhizobium phage RHph_Y1_11]
MEKKFIQWLKAHPDQERKFIDLYAPDGVDAYFGEVDVERIDWAGMCRQFGAEELLGGSKPRKGIVVKDAYGFRVHVGKSDRQSVLIRSENASIEVDFANARNLIEELAGALGYTSLILSKGTLPDFRKGN